MEEETEQTEKYKDALGQENPAQDLLKKTIEEKNKAAKEAVDAEKAAQPEGA